MADELDEDALVAEERMTRGELAIYMQLKKVDRSLGAIRSGLSERPTRDEVAGRRRVTALLVLGIVLVVVQAVDAGAVHCTPGERAAHVADALLDDEPTLDSVREVVRRPAPAGCDVLLPARAHSPRADWPTGPNIAGLALYVAVGAVLWLWASLPLSRARRRARGGPKPQRRHTDTQEAPHA